jgi:hypothetical protein
MSNLHFFQVEFDAFHGSDYKGRVWVDITANSREQALGWAERQQDDDAAGTGWDYHLTFAVRDLGSVDAALTECEREQAWEAAHC